MALTAKEMAEKLEQIAEGDTVFVSYIAGRKPTERAVQEAQKAEDEGYVRRWFAGKLQGKWTTKKGDSVFCIYSHTRYNAKDPNAQGHYRTFNPNLGKLLAVVKLAPEDKDPS